jgi:hypothetical protein
VSDVVRDVLTPFNCVTMDKTPPEIIIAELQQRILHMESASLQFQEDARARIDELEIENAKLKLENEKLKLSGGPYEA